MEQQPLIVEDIYDALRDCVKSLGGPKKVGQRMWPEKTMNAARTYLSNCLDRNRREILDPEQVIWILREARQAGCHIGMYYITDECHYERPRPIEPEDEKAELMRDFIKSVEKHQSLADRFEKLGIKLKVTD